MLCAARCAGSGAGVDPGILVGGILGSRVTVWISTQMFAVLFTVVVFFAASNILLDRKPKPSRPLPGALGRCWWAL